MCSSCSSGATIHESRLGSDVPAIALVGRPNVGKSTLFTRLTGTHQKMANYPATTVEVSEGLLEIGKQKIRIIDLPGTCSLDAVSPDEQLTTDVIAHGNIDLAVVLVDASNVARCLYLATEMRESGIPMVVAVTMTDLAERRGITLDLEVLARELMAPAIAVTPRLGQGIDDLKKSLLTYLDKNPNPHEMPIRDEDERLEFVNTIIGMAVQRKNNMRTTSDRVDQILTGPITGLAFLLVVLWGVFQATTTLATPLMDLIDSGLNTFIAAPLSAALVGIPWLHGLVVNGIVAGVGTLLTFLPVMSIMFLILSVLEDSGYMSRAAVVSDRIMRFAGLPGRALLPLLVGFGCNVPAISATRALPDARHRLLTGLSVPFTACSARLAVYVFVAEIFFKKNAGTVIFLMYLLSIALVVFFALFMRLTFVRGAKRDPLFIELPPYRLPTSQYVLTDAWIRVKGFLREAGGIVVTTVIVVWFLMATPTSSQYAFTETPVENSAYGAVSKTISPIFEPAGFADWHTTGALVTGFVAKEVVIASWGQNYAVDDVENPVDRQRLTQQLKNDFEASSGGHAAAAVIAFLIFLTAYTPCVATVAAQKREFGLKWALTGIAIQLTLAWVLAVVAFNILKNWL